MEFNNWREQLVMFVDNNFNDIVKTATSYSDNKPNASLDAATFYSHMNIADAKDQGDLIALAKAIQLWRFMTAFDPTTADSNAMMPNNVLRQAMFAAMENTTDCSAINSPYIVKHVQPMQPLLTQPKYAKRNSKEDSKIPKRQRNHLGVNQTSFMSESNVIYALFKALHELHNCMEDKLPLPATEEELARPASFEPLIDVESMFFGKLYAGPQPATFCLQTHMKRVYGKTRHFYSSLQQSNSNLKCKAPGLYMQGNRILCELHNAMQQMNAFADVNFTFKGGYFINPQTNKIATCLLDVVQLVIKKVREANNSLHLFTWEMAHCAHKSGAFYTTQEQIRIVKEYVLREQESLLLDSFYANWTKFPIMQSEEPQVVNAAKVEPIVPVESEVYEPLQQMTAFNDERFDALHFSQMSPRAASANFIRGHGC